MSSVIPAFAKSGDLIICDEGVSYGSQQGINLSRSNLIFFKHNDMEDLENVLRSVAEKDAKSKSKKKYRRFIVVEGIYQYHGDICPLDKVMELKKKFFYRLVLDDSLGFGVLGDTGRGSPEHFGVDIQDVDFYCVTADTALATTGGFCLGNDQVVDHQRLSGAGYCFSASSPPFCSAAGVYNIGMLEKNPSLCADVRGKASFLRSKLAKIDGITLGSAADVSPVVHLRLTRSFGTQRQDLRFFLAVKKQLFAKGIVADVPTYIPMDKRPPPPSMRLVCSTVHTKDHLSTVAAEVQACIKTALKASY
jgi:serine palmitoyltransferase